MNEKKYTVTWGKQLRGFLSTHLICAVLMFAMGMPLILGLDKYPVWPLVICGLFSLIYCWVVFLQAYSAANHDLKTFSVLKPFPWKGAVFGLFLCGITLILWILCKIGWLYFGATDTTSNIVRIGCNALFLVWTAPFHAFLNLNYGVMSVWGHLVIYIVPMIGAVLGYYCGYRKWDLSQKLSFLVYEKKK